MGFNPQPKPGKKKRKKNKNSDPGYKEWTKKQGCCNPKCQGGCGQVTHCHMRILGNGGTGIKPPDKDGLPLGVICHNLSHLVGDITFWGQKNKSDTKEFVEKICDFLYNEYTKHRVASLKKGPK